MLVGCNAYEWKNYECVYIAGWSQLLAVSCQHRGLPSVHVPTRGRHITRHGGS